jgi:NitT/TauT family transport system substrate-binding protein
MSAEGASQFGIPATAGREVLWIDPGKTRPLEWIKMKANTMIRISTAIFFLTVCLGAPVSRSISADYTWVQVGYGGIAGYQLPIWVNKEAGISKKYGIELEPLLISGGALGMQALLAGSIQMSQNSASAAIQAELRGAPVVLIAALENRMPLQIVARPEIKTPQQLIGKKIGILRFGGSNDTGVQWALRAWKIDPRQVTILQSGATNARMTALTLGQIDATILSYPEIYIARKRGMNVLADIGDFSAYPNTSLLLTRSFIEKQRPLAKNLLRSQIESIHYVRTNREGSLKILKKYLRLGDDSDATEAIGATYDFFSRRIEAVPRPNLEGLKNILREMGAPQRNPTEFIDMSLLDEIEKDGFIQRLR